MKQKKLILAFLLLTAVSCSPVIPTVPQTSMTAPAAVSSPGSLSAIPWDDPQLFAAGLVQSQRGAFSAIPGASIYHLDLTVDADLVHIKGHEDVRYTNREMASLDRIEFRLFPNILGGEMTVSNLTLDGKPVTPGYKNQNSVMVVPYPAPAPAGQTSLVSMDFEETVPTNPQTNYGVLSSSDGVLTLSHSYPMIPAYDQNGWSDAVPAPWGDLTYTDPAYYVVQVTAPAGLTLIATGREFSTASDTDTRTATYALGPAHDFAVTAAKDFKVVSDTIGEVTVNSYAPSTDMDVAAQALDVATHAVQDYSNRYAPYPYTRFNIVATPTSALGIEYPGLIDIAYELYKGTSSQYGASNRAYLESTVAHETGHQWFYNLVGDDQLNQPWLDESLAQYVTWQYYEDRYGDNAAQGFKQSLQSRWDRVSDEKIPVGKPVAAYTSKEYGAIVYGRGPLFFFALDDQLGQSGFDRFLQDYVKQYTWQNATTSGLQKAAEQECGCDLTSLFNDWVTP